MHFSLDQILPSLESLGLWSYWIIGLASLLEAFFIAGVIVPGTLVVIAGGILVQQGLLDFFDLAWFIAIGSVIGGELGYWTGRLARHGLQNRWDPKQSKGYQKAENLFRKHGGLALVMGRFLGPVSGLVPFAASVAGMERRKFLVWNTISGFPYALITVAFGYFLGDVIARLGPLMTRVALFAGAVAIVVAILWWLVIRIERMLPFVLSIFRSLLQAIAENPGVHAWSGRHPKLAGFVAGRFDPTRFAGLSATLLGLVSFYVFTIWLGSVLDFLLAEPIVLADTRLANLIHVFWTPGLLRFFTHLTALGDWRVVALLLAAGVLWSLKHSRRDLATGLFVAVAGNVVSVSILKAIFHRPRPDLAYFAESSGSFPSGHAAISVALYAMLFYVAWRLRVVGPLTAAILAATLALVIGMSRLYLIEHYLTDVLNGWLVGTLWLVIGIAVAEWWHETHKNIAETTKRDRGRDLVVVGLCALLVTGAVWRVTTYDKARNIAVVSQASQIVPDIAALFASGNVPLTTESVSGAPLEPINVIIAAPNRDTLETALQTAGWIAADKPGLVSLTRAAWAAWGKQKDTTAPITPYFWENRPNDMAFQRPTTDRTLRKRHHVRLWKTNFTTSDALEIFVGAASFDAGLDWGRLHHIDPNIDAERDTLAQGLKNAGLVQDLKEILITAPRLDQSVAGDPWLTDGRAVVLTIK